jgi:hypothetical protein
LHDREWAHLLDVRDEDWEDALDVCRDFAATNGRQVEALARLISGHGVFAGRVMVATLREDVDTPLDWAEAHAATQGDTDQQA